MAFQPVADALQAVINGSMGSIPFVNVFGVVFTGTFNESVANGVGDFFRDAYGDNLSPLQNTNYAVSSITITDLRVETGAQFDYTDTEPMTGQSDSQALPFQTAALISWGTGVRGRGFRGRTYLGAFNESGSNGRELDPVIVAGMNDFIDAVVAAETIGVISRFHGVEEDGTPIPRDPGIITPITSGVAHNRWRTQRRRALASD